MNITEVRDRCEEREQGYPNEGPRTTEIEVQIDGDVGIEDQENNPDEKKHEAPVALTPSGTSKANQKAKPMDYKKTQTCQERTQKGALYVDYRGSWISQSL